MKQNMKTTIRYIKTEGKWFPITGDSIDQRSPGESSKRAVLGQLRERSEFTDRKFVAKFD